TPAPLTSLTIHVRGLSRGAKVSVTFSDRSGFLVSESPVSTTTSSVVVGVPVYCNSKTGALTAGRVSITVVQGTRKSLARTLTIRQLPSASAQGMPLGEV